MRGGIGGLWVVDWPERLLPMWLETLREQLRLHLQFFLFSGMATVLNIRSFLLSMLCFPNGVVCGVNAKVTLRSPQGTNANALESLQNLSQALEAAGDRNNSKCKGNTALQQGS